MAPSLKDIHDILVYKKIAIAQKLVKMSASYKNISSAIIHTRWIIHNQITHL